MKQHYRPDRTWKNIWSALRISGDKPIILSCKECPEGLALKDRRCLSLLIFLCNTLGGLLAIALYVLFIPAEWSKAGKLLVAVLVIVFYVGPLSIVPILLSFRISKLWVPARAIDS